MKKILLLSTLIHTSTMLYAQQWDGSTTTSGQISRSGKISVEGLVFGKYGSTLSGDPDPFQISSPDNIGTHDLIFYGSGSSSTLNLRMYDGSLKFGSSSTPNAEIYNDGGGLFNKNIQMNHLILGRYGNSLAGDSDPYQIASIPNDGNHDLIIYGNNSTSTLNLRLLDGSFKVGSSATPNAEIYNNGSGYFNGSVGIGTSSPGSTLDVRGQKGNVDDRNFRVRYIQLNNQWVGGAELAGIAHVDGQWTAMYARQGNSRSAAYFDGNVGFNTNTPGSTLDLLGKNGNVDDRNFRVRYYQLNNQWVGGAELAGVAHIEGQWTAMYAKQGNSRSAAYFDGKVGIGTNTPDSELAVNGVIHSREVKIDLNGWPDFVFKKDYDLRTLEEVEQHINENGHLPEIPSEEEVTENGINLGEMNAKLLQKIEELTLYLIEQNKEIKVLKEKVSFLETQGN